MMVNPERVELRHRKGNHYMEMFHPEGAGFHRMQRLPPYIFGIVNQLKMEARRRGEDIIDLGMGNPDLPTPKHIIN